VQDILKVGFYWLLDYFDIAHKKTGEFQNIRGHEEAHDEHKDMAIGLVENKYMEATMRESERTTEATLDAATGKQLKDALKAIRDAAKAGDTAAVNKLSMAAMATADSATLEYDEKTRIRAAVLDVKNTAKRAATANAVRESVKASRDGVEPGSFRLPPAPVEERKVAVMKIASPIGSESPEVVKRPAPAPAPAPPALSVTPEELDTEVSRYLDRLKLGKYKLALYSQDITEVDHLRDFTRAQLKEYGLTDGAATRILGKAALDEELALLGKPPLKDDDVAFRGEAL